MRLFELFELQPFKTDEYNTPNQMEIMANPDYWREKKGVVGRVEWMTPTQYIRACELGFRRTDSPGLIRQGRNAELINQYAVDMKRGDKFPMLELDYRDNHFGQEGLHRAMAAEKIGVKHVPVFIMKDSPEKKASMNEAAIRIGGKKNPKVQEFMDKYYKVTQPHPFDPSSRVAWDGKSTATVQPFPDYINLSAIQTLAPGERTGSANGLVMTLVALADETGVPVRLSAKPFGNMEGKLTKRQLIAWYKRKGFVPDSAGGSDMTYTPPVKENITEGLSPILYHFTSPTNTLNMLKQNRIKLAASPGSESEASLQSGDRVYYLSTTRHKMGGYHLNNNLSGVMINFDGTKLGQRYKGKAVDYWGPEWYGDDRKGYEEKEAEDRLFSREPYIPNAKQYIQSIHIMYTEKGQKYHKDSGLHIRRLIITAKSAGIPTYLYDNAKSWMLQNTKQAINPNSIDLIKKSSGKKYDQGGYHPGRRNNFSGWLELYHIDSRDKLTKNSSLEYKYVMDYPNDGVSQLKIAIHNNKTKPDQGLSSILRIMRKEKFARPADFIAFLEKKWQAEYEARQNAS